jgi:hypothetical protein
MTPSERDSLRRLYQLRCGYCGVREIDAGSALTFDHFHPRSRGGTDSLDNQVYCCHACNEFKSDYWEPDSPRRLLHPLRDSIEFHIREDAESFLRPLTETGAFHIERLRLNRPQLVEYRRERRLWEAARKTQSQLTQLLSDLNQWVRRTIAELESLGPGQNE